MKQIFDYFATDGKVLSYRPWGDGHINRTFLFTTDQGRKYILQRINDSVFRNVDALMENIVNVTGFLRKKGLDPRHVLTLVPLVSTTLQDPLWFIKWEEESIDFSPGYYRVYEFITGGLCLSHPDTCEDFRQSAIAFGQFQRDLSDFNASILHETIPHFHDTRDRYAKFHAALDADAAGRVKEVQSEIDFLLCREKEAGHMLDMRDEGKLPERVTHNDTKLNNVIFDAASRTPLCVIDLDTVMPGLAGYDFGDAIRFGANTGSEDEKDLSKISVDMDMFCAFTDGFLSVCGSSLLPEEIETLPLGARIITIEQAIRFLTDYLEGDIYYHTDYPGHNLDRTRTQIRLVLDMEEKWEQMRREVC